MPSPFLAAVARAGATLDRRAARSRAGDFAAIAADVLGGARLNDRFALSAILDWTLAARVVPPSSVAFDEPDDAPVLPLFASERIAIDLHLHAPSMTTIHDHDFDGAVLALEGTSLYAEYAFDDARAVARHVRTGALRAVAPLRMSPGAVVPIRARRTIHRVAHLGDRTALLVARARVPLGAAPQHVYSEAGLAWRVFARGEPGRPPAHDARAQVLGFLGPREPALAHRFLLAALRASDAWSSLAYLLGNWEYLDGTGELARALASLRRRLGPWIDRLPAVQRGLADDDRLRLARAKTEEARLRAALRRIAPVTPP